MLLWRKGGQEQTGEIDVKRPYVAAVVVAAGTSSRMQGLDKQLEEVGGIPVIVRTLLALSDSDWIDEIVLVTRRGTIPDMLALARALGRAENPFCYRRRANASTVGSTWRRSGRAAGKVCGGSRRRTSVCMWAGDR